MKKMPPPRGQVELVAPAAMQWQLKMASVAWGRLAAAGSTTEGLARARALGLGPRTRSCGAAPSATTATKLLAQPATSNFIGWWPSLPPLPSPTIFAERA